MWLVLFFSFSFLLNATHVNSVWWEVSCYFVLIFLAVPLVSLGWFQFGTLYFCMGWFLSIHQRRFRDVSISHLVKEDDKDSGPEFCIDAGSTGNVARFINHSCQPNLFVQCVLSDHHDMKLARVILFAADNIPALKVSLSLPFRPPLSLFPPPSPSLPKFIWRLITLPFKMLKAGSWLIFPLVNCNRLITFWHSKIRVRSSC